MDEREEQSGSRRRTDAGTRRPRWLPETTDLLTDVIQALSKSGGADSRSWFERVVSQRTGFPYVRLRDVGPGQGQASGGMPLSCPVPWSGGAVVLEADSNVRAHLVDASKRRLLRAAAQVAGVVLQAEASSGGKGGGALSGGGGGGGAGGDRPDDRPLVGSSGVMAALRARIDRVARTDYRVLIEGETGAGKEIVARQVHRLSARHAGPFVPVNCAALVDTLMDAQLFGIEERTATGVRAQRGIFEKAHSGVLFLDEVGELPWQAQAKILRVLQEATSERVGASGLRRVDVRVIAATNRQLSSLVEQGKFREDLYYRISAVHVRVPPLREHPEDILELALAHFRQPSDREKVMRITPEAIEALMLYAWPGNVRQLERVLEQAVTEADEEIQLQHLPEAIRSPYRQIVQPLAVRDDSMRAWRSRYARLVLHRCGDNKREACRTLEISYHTLRAYLRDGRPRRGTGGRGSGS